jgi:hypothetical protein
MNRFAKTILDVEWVLSPSIVPHGTSYLGRKLIAEAAAFLAALRGA